MSEDRSFWSLDLEHGPDAFGGASSNTDTANADTTTTFFDAYGYPTWEKDGGGFITYSQIDPLTGGVVKTINDVNTSDTGDFSNLPSGWTTPAGGGQELITTKPTGVGA